MTQKKFSADQVALLKKANDAAQKDIENAIEVGFAKAAHDKGLSEAEFTAHYQAAVSKLQKEASAKA